MRHDRKNVVSDASVQTVKNRGGTVTTKQTKNFKKHDGNLHQGIDEYFINNVRRKK
jgi:hypothetical protein